MGFFDIFKDNHRDEDWEKQAKLQDWNDIVYTGRDFDMDDPVQRREYVGSCLQQMQEAALELDELEMEYNDVTSHLRDIDEIDALPSDKRSEINDCAEKIIHSLKQQEKFDRRRSRMTDEEFERMERLEGSAKEGTKKLYDAEDYQRKIRNDLKRLDNEHEAYLFEKNEALRTIENTKRLIVATGISLVVIIIFLLILQYGLELNVIYGMLITVFLAAIAVTLFYVNNMNAQSDLKLIDKSIARLIMLQNQVKIRYVNNTNLIDYLCLKYGVSSAKQLYDLYDKYIAEKKAREKAEDAKKLLDANEKDLVFMLRQYRIRDPEIWVHQADALIDHKEEVELRHSLNVQRQSLRKRMEYNKDVVAGNAKAEIEEMARQYPKYAQEILDMVSRYDERYPDN